MRKAGGGEGAGGTNLLVVCLCDVRAGAWDWLVAVTADKLIQLLIIPPANHSYVFIFN